MGIDHLDIQNKSFTTSKILSEGHIGFEELIKRNLWTLKGEMSVKRILKNLFKDVPEFLETIYIKYEDDFIDGQANTIFERLKEDLKFNSWLIAIRSQKLLKTGIYGADMVDILFPPCLIEFRIEDKEHGLLGQIDKIEIVDI
jgi:CRISPR-associated exonuclease Cas4